MKALDTNILVRFLVNDDKKMGAAARRLLESAHDQGDHFLVTAPVLLELLWVLKSVYGLPRADVLEALEALARMPVLKADPPGLVLDLARGARSTRLDLADLLIGLCAREKGCQATWTLDAKAAGSNLFQLLPLSKLGKMEE